MKLNSSCITEASYDDANAILFVNFVNGRKYRYESVPRSAYDELVSAASAGRVFNASIRGNYVHTEL